MSDELWKCINGIDILSLQIDSLLDMLVNCGENTDIESIKTTAEITTTIFCELMQDVNTVVKAFREFAE